MTDNEKFSLLAEVLKRQHHVIDHMTGEQLKEYVELMSIFLKTNDCIYEESSLSTMTLMVKNVMYYKQQE